MATVLNPKFSLVFDIANNTVTFTDTSDSWTALCEGTPRITHEDSDTIIYNGSGWNATTPTWSTPPIHDGSLSIDDIDLPTVYAGTYKVEYWTRSAAGATPVLTTRRYTLDYVSPEVTINYQILCSTSQLVSTIVDNFDMDFEGVTVHPTATPSHTIVKPTGSGYTGTLGTTADWTRTIGGGESDETRLWTRVWQIVASVALSYAVRSWDDNGPTVYITDTVTGNDEANVKCNTTICALATCYANLLTRWRAARTANTYYYVEKTPVVNEAMGLFIQLLWYERCGVDPESTVLALQTVLSGENCDCSSNPDTASAPVSPWGVASGVIGLASTFKFWIETTSPTSQDGTNGDAWLNTTTSDIYSKSAGAWTLKGNIKGTPGADGTSDAKIQLIVSDMSAYPTPASKTPTPISYGLDIDNSMFDWEGDEIEFMWEVKLAHNDNGKTLTVLFDSDTMLEWFADDLAAEGNDIVTVHMRLVRETNITQHITTWLERAGELYGPFYFRSYSKDLNTPCKVVLEGTNSENSAGDITGYHTHIMLRKRETTIIEGGDVSGATKASQLFIATEGQTQFTVTDFTATPYYLALIDYVPQSDGVVTRVGQVFTTPAMTAGQTLLIVRI